MSAVAFVDTNILIYAHDLDAGVKRELAMAQLRELWDSGTGRLSVQVLQEFYVNATQKLATPIARSTARENQSGTPPKPSHGEEPRSVHRSRM